MYTFGMEYEIPENIMWLITTTTQTDDMHFWYFIVLEAALTNFLGTTKQSLFGLMTKGFWNYLTNKYFIIPQRWESWLVTDHVLVLHLNCKQEHCKTCWYQRFYEEEEWYVCWYGVKHCPSTSLRSHLNEVLSWHFM